MALTLTLAGVDQTSKLRYRSLRVTRTNGARPGRATFDLINYVPLLDACVIADGATTYFDGLCRGTITNEYTPATAFTSVSAVDAGDVPTPADAPFALGPGTPSAETIYQTVMAPADPLSWWRLGESSGTNAVDETTAQAGTYVDTPTLGVAGAVSSIANTAVTFNGTSEYVTVGNARLAGLSAFTIAAWAKSAANGGAIYAEREATNTNPLVQFYIDSGGKPVLRIRDNAGTEDYIYPATGDWADGAWHHFLVTKTGTVVVIYVDGVIVKTGTLTCTNTLTGTLLAFIGYTPVDSRHFDGSLDEAMIWNSAVGHMAARLYNMSKEFRAYTSMTIKRTYNLLDPTNSMEGSVSTFDAGLAPGQSLAVISSGDSHVLADTYLIQELTVEWKNATTPFYTATFGDVPIRLAAAFP